MSASRRGIPPLATVARHLGAIVFSGFCFSAAHAQLEWRELPGAPVSPTIRHDDLCFVDENRGWVVNVSGEIHHTTDGGASWVLQAQTGTLNRCVGFANAQRGWVGTLSPATLLLETFDGGATWAPAPGGPTGPPGICGLSVVSDQVVFGASVYFEPASLFRTTNGGTTWDTLSMAAHASTLIDVHFTSPDSGFVVGGFGDYPESISSRILFTSDGGSTWVTRFAGSRAGEWGWKISFPNPLVGYVSLERIELDGLPNHFAKTTDGGVTWTDAPFGPNVQAIGFATDTHGWIGGRATTTHETTDGGSTWNPILPGRNLNRIRFVRPDLAYACGKSVYKYSDPNVTSIETPLQAIQSADHLRVLSANPFRREVRFAWGTNSPAVTTLDVHDAAGARVRRLLAPELPHGRTEMSWDGRDDHGRPLASGVYFLRLVTEARRESARVLLLR